MWIRKNSLLAGGVRLQSGRGPHEFIAHLSRRRLGTFCFLLSPAAFLAVTFAEKNLQARSADAPVLIWDIDLTLAWALPRNVCTTDTPLKTSDDKTLSTSRLLDLHASGREELTTGRLNGKKNRQ